MKMGLLRFFEASIILSCLGTTLGAGWSYFGANGPSHWSSSYPTCGGSSQSPIDIDTEDADIDNDLNAFSFTGYNELIVTTHVSLVNNGHAAQVSWTGSYPTVSGGGLPATYKLAQFHFHWGSTSEKGSEHETDGFQYAAEMHLVHFKSSYASLGDAAASGASDALAVIGVYIEESGLDNSAYAPIIDRLPNVIAADATTTLTTSFKLEDLLPEHADAYYRYNGGLTTPGCNEIVIWTVMKDAVKMSSAQMNKLRALQDSSSSSIVDNFRPVQSRNGRKVYASPRASAGSLVANALLVISALFVVRSHC